MKKGNLDKFIDEQIDYLRERYCPEDFEKFVLLQGLKISEEAGEIAGAIGKTFGKESYKPDRNYANQALEEELVDTIIAV